MYPLDFEEFLWANGINDTVIDSVRTCFENETAIPDGIHKAMMELLYRYIIVGGLPEVVNCFLDTKNIELIYKAQRNLIAEYEEDMVKYADDVILFKTVSAEDLFGESLAETMKRKTYKIAESHPAIISKEDFERVQQMKAKRSRKKVDYLPDEQHDE